MEALDGEIDLDTTGDEILLAATNHDLDGLRTLLKTGSANVRDEDTGSTPLHAAIASCEGGNPEVEHAAVDTVKLLFENGAIWNDLDINNETPGCVALRLGLKDAYNAVVDAGVRAELLLNRLDEFQILARGSDNDSDDEENVNGDDETDHYDTEQVTANSIQDESADTTTNGDALVADVNSARYLASQLTFSGDRLLDADDNGVMMAWETDLMRLSADALLPPPSEHQKRVLNVGHGMGIIDGIFQAKRPSQHHIIEAHPAVVERMRSQGWHDKDGVVVHEGKWQDIVPGLVEQGLVFDAIYFDTFAEDYKALKDFFTEHVIALLDPAGCFGFFNGLGADRQVCYDVYAKIVEMDLDDAGLDVEWRDVAVADLDKEGEWEGVRRKYWTLDTYRLPTCRFMG